MGQFEPSLPLGHGTGERSLLVAEELALDQRLRQGGAVDLDKRLLRPRALRVQRPGNKFLAGAAFALDQHGDLCLRNPLDQRACSGDQVAFPENFPVGIVHHALHHGRIGPGDVVEVAGLVQCNLDLLAGKGLGQVVEGARLETIQNEGVRFAVDQRDQERLFGPLTDVPEKVQQLAFGQFRIDENQVELILAEIVVDILYRTRLGHIDPLAADKLSHRSAKIVVAFGQYDLFKWHLVLPESVRLSGAGTFRPPPPGCSAARRVTDWEAPCHAEVSVFRSPGRASRFS